MEKMNQGPVTEVVVQSWPAADLVVRTGGFGRPMLIKDGELLATLWKHRDGNWYPQRYYAGSVVSYAMRNRDCPIKAIEHAKSRGHDLHWISQSSTMITAEARPRERLIKIEIGMLVEFEGRVFRIEKHRYSSGNLILVEVSDDVYSWAIEQRKLEAAEAEGGAA